MPCPVCCGFEARLAPPDPDRPAWEVFPEPAAAEDGPEAEMTFNDLLELFR